MQDVCERKLEAMAMRMQQHKSCKRTFRSAQERDVLEHMLQDLRHILIACTAQNIQC